jgi:DNA-binding MarR family transcriptional regulator
MTTTGQTAPTAQTAERKTHNQNTQKGGIKPNIAPSAGTGQERRERTGAFDPSDAGRIVRAVGIIDSRGLPDTPRVTQGELGILGALAQREGTATPGELAHDLSITSARIANALKTLERKGYILRTNSTQDRRAVIVTLTETGKAYGESCYHKAVQDARRVLAPLTPAEQAELARLADKLADALLQEEK